MTLEVLNRFQVSLISSGKSEQQREGIIRSFRLGHIWFLICTDLMARGIDFCNVNTVIQFDFPESVVQYIHRVGRTGRMSEKGLKKGTSVVFFTEADKNLREIASAIKKSGGSVPRWLS